MRRLLRHLFTACAALSLMLCVAVGVLWVRSYHACDTVRVYADASAAGRCVEIDSTSGRISALFDGQSTRVGSDAAWFGNVAFMTDVPYPPSTVPRLASTVTRCVGSTTLGRRCASGVVTGSYRF